jgi:hypothetical protein
MPVTTLNLIIYYIRPEDSAKIQLQTSIDIVMRLNELEVMCRSLLLSPRSNDYFALIIPNMEMIRMLESPTDSYIKLLSKSKQKYMLLEDCEYEYGYGYGYGYGYEYGKKSISEKVCLR